MSGLEAPVGVVEKDQVGVAAIASSRGVDELMEGRVEVRLDAQLLKAEAARPGAVALFERPQVQAHMSCSHVSAAP